MSKKTQAPAKSGMVQTKLDFFIKKPSLPKPIEEQKLIEPPEVSQKQKSQIIIPTSQTQNLEKADSDSATIELEDNISEVLSYQSAKKSDFDYDQLDDLLAEDKEKNLRRSTTFQPEHIYEFPHYNEKYWEKIKAWVGVIAAGDQTTDKFCQIIEHIMGTNMKAKKTNLVQLKAFFNSLPSAEKEHCEKKVLPFIASLVLETEDLFATKQPFLKQGTPYEIKFTKKQCACLLANMYMCINFRQNNRNLPWDFNFSYFFSSGSMRDTEKEHKLHCFYNYFRRIQADLPDRYVIFKRLVLSEDVHGPISVQTMLDSDDPMAKVVVSDTGTIEDEVDALEVDFANKYLGGGALGGGNVQEEIMFAVAPECLVGMLFAEYMLDYEAILIQGAEIYSLHSGYARSFKYERTFFDKRKINKKDHILNREIIAIDAIPFGSKTSDQFSKGSFMRELRKAYIGFLADDDLGFPRKAISTGRWGCGAFGGDSQLKFIIQWIAASKAGREMKFFTFGDKLLNRATNVVKFYAGKSTGIVMKDVMRYCEKIYDFRAKRVDLFDFILN